MLRHTAPWQLLEDDLENLRRDVPPPSMGRAVRLCHQVGVAGRHGIVDGRLRVGGMELVRKLAEQVPDKLVPDGVRRIEVVPSQLPKPAVPGDEQVPEGLEECAEWLLLHIRVLTRVVDTRQR